jgi:hypothetical protein
MRQIIRKIFKSVSHALIVLLCVTFGVSGAVPVSQILSTYERIAALEESASPTYLIHANPSDVEPQGDMSPNAKANADQPMVTFAVQAKSETSSQSDSDRIQGDGYIAIGKLPTTASSSIRTTASSISTSLGLQFRLLGEKPSGTS